MRSARLARARAIAAAAIALLAPAAPLPADPRWWSPFFSPGTTGVRHPDIAIAGFVPATGYPIVVATWEQDNVLGGDSDVAIAHGSHPCYACGYAWPAEFGVSETNPRIAAGITPANRVSVQVVYERDGQIWVTSGAERTPEAIGANQGCVDAGRIFPRTTTLLSRPGPGVDLRPRIAVARKTGPGGFLQFHAVWYRVPPSGPPTIEYASDLIGDGTGWSGGTDVSAAIGLNGTMPDVAADSLATTGSAATVFFLDLAGSVRATRWTGTAWLAARAVSGGAGLEPPDVDAGSSESGDASVWSGAVWHPELVPHDIHLDAARWTSPSARSPDFDPSNSDVVVSTPPDTPGRGPSLAIGPPPSAGSASPALAMWSTETVPSEIVWRAGALSASLPDPRAFDRVPFPARRIQPPDATASRVTQLSSCAWDEASGDCLPVPRLPASVGASEVAVTHAAASRGLPWTFAAIYLDDAGGPPTPVILVTDGDVAPAHVPRFTASDAVCEGLGRARAELTFEQGPVCADLATNDVMRRFFLYHGCEAPCADGATPTGPFPNREIYPVQGRGARTVTLSGLRAGVVHDFAIVPEDAARNLHPAGFDATVSSNPAASFRAGQLLSLTLPPCGPVVSGGCDVGLESCGGVSDGVFNPGDRVLLTLTLRNTGDLDATGVQGTVVASDAVVVAPPGGQLTVPVIPAGSSSAPIPVEVVLAAACPLAPSIAVTGLRSNASSPGGPVTYPDLACAAIAPIVCSSPCTACVAPALPAVDGLLAARTGAGRSVASFAWVPAAAGNPAEYHLNAVARPGDLAAVRRPPAGSGEARCTVAAPGATACDDAPAVGDPRPLLLYRVLAACAAAGSEEGPE